MPPHRPLLAAAAFGALAALAACSKAVDEPNAPPAAASATPVAPLLFDTPGGWTKLEAPSSGPKKGSYRIDKVGNDKEEAEMNVFFGTGAKGDPAPLFKEWFSQFDGDVGATAARQQLEVKGFKVDTVEASGTYKIGLTPTPRGRKQAPVQMVKNGWRLYGAVVRTTDRGNWFFKITGPDETVQASKSTFRAMLETLR